MSITSVQQAGAVAVPRVKTSPNDIGNAVKSFFAQTPAAYAAQAVGQTVDFGVIPAGSRILPTGKLSAAAGAASSTLDIGLKNASDGTVIDADGLAVGVNLTAAGVKDVNGGALVGAGVGYVTPVDVIVYGTFAGATNTANQQFCLNLEYITGF
ncbi:MAG TPA: hypothetical protein VN023_09535 [Methylovorus sp.]|nr:hypothetical protein [Methylovorus sp.]